MMPFDQLGRDWRHENRFRRVVLEILLAVCALLLLPFTLMLLLLWSLWRWSQLWTV
jgi:hypothetical protein